MASLLLSTDTMFSANRVRPWHGLGKIIDEAPNSADALRIAGLDWTVIQKPVYTDGGIQIPHYCVNMRDRDGMVLGVVSDRYKIVQNIEAFSFTDNLIGGDVRYETAGSLRNGKTVWMLAKMPETKILGDKFEPYLCFVNNHSGESAVTVCLTPVRCVCANTVNLALRTAKRSWSTKHMGDMGSKLYEAERALGLADDYMTNLSKEAEMLANSPISNEEIAKILEILYPVKDDDSSIKKERATKIKTDIMTCYYAPDIAQFMGTKYGFVNAIADYVDHSAPLRETATYRENNWGKIMGGHPILDKVYELLTVGADA